VRRGGVGPCIAKRSETGFPIGDRREGVQQVARRSGQPVKPRHHHHVAGVELGQQAAKLRPVGLRTARHFAEDLAGAGRAKLPDLGVNALAVRRPRA
jgi:hypothetical protein